MIEPSGGGEVGVVLKPQAQVETNLTRVHQLMSSFDNAKLYIETFRDVRDTNLHYRIECLRANNDDDTFL